MRFLYPFLWTTKPVISFWCLSSILLCFAIYDARRVDIANGLLIFMLWTEYMSLLNEHYILLSCNTAVASSGGDGNCRIGTDCHTVNLQRILWYLHIPHHYCIHERYERTFFNERNNSWYHLVDLSWVYVLLTPNGSINITPSSLGPG